MLAAHNDLNPKFFGKIFPDCEISRLDVRADAVPMCRLDAVPGRALLQFITVTGGHFSIL